MEWTSDVFGNGIFALGSAILAALLAVGYQHWQYSQQLRQAREDAVADGKKRIIEDLVRYRFVLSNRRNDPEPTMHFNSALNAVPVHFSASAECMRLYAELGQNFTADKFEGFIKALMADVPLSAAALNTASLAVVPSVAPKTN